MQSEQLQQHRMLECYQTMTTITTAGKPIVYSLLPDHQVVEFRHNRKKYTAMGWFEKRPNANTPVFCSVVLYRGIVDNVAPIPNGLFHNAPLICNPDPEQVVDITLDHERTRRTT